MFNIEKLIYINGNLIAQFVNWLEASIILIFMNRDLIRISGIVICKSGMLIYTSEKLVLHL